VRELWRGLADGNPVVLWDTMPASYQEDLTLLVRDAAAEMDPELWDRVVYTLDKARQVLTDKRDLLRAYPVLAAQLQGQPEVADRNWDAVVALLNVILESDLRSQRDAKKIDIRRFLKTTGADMMRQMRVINEIASE
jgi:hypothetical protein